MNIPPKVHIKILQGLIAQEKISREDLAVLLERPVSDIYKRLDPNQSVDFSADEIRQIAVWLGNMGYMHLSEVFQPPGARLNWLATDLSINGNLDDELKALIRDFNKILEQFDIRGDKETMRRYLNSARKIIDQAEAEVNAQ